MLIPLEFSFNVCICVLTLSQQAIFSTTSDILIELFYNVTRKYMHAETLADKTIVFSEREVFKVVVMVTQ